jgi:transposase InsO family protein
MPTGGGPSWLTFIGQMKDSLWSLDLFRCESVALRTYWVLVVMDQYTRRIIGFGIQAGVVDGLALCRMFKQAIRGASLPKYVSSDHDPLYRFHQWEANLRILGVTEIKTVPYTPGPTIHRAINRDHPTRVFGPVVVLDGNGLRNKTSCVQRLLQPASKSFWAERKNSD